MAEITTALVKELRERTGAGMMDCKRALARGRRRHRGRDRLAAQEGSGGGRQEGQPGHQRGPDRHGADRHGRGAGRGQRRDRLRRPQRDLPGAGAADRRAGAGAPRATSRRCKAARIEATGRTVAEEITQAIAVIGENINLRRTAYLEVPQGAVAGYLHNQLAPGLGKLGVLVALASPGEPAPWPSSASSSRCTSRRPTRRR